MLGFAINKISPVKTVILILLIAVGSLVLPNILLHSALSSKPHQSTTVQLRPQQNPIKSILLWNGSGRKEVRAFGLGQQAFINQNCTYTQCDMTDNRSEHPIEHYDAVVVVFNDEFTSEDQLRMPQFKNGRNPNQRVVFFTQESPVALKAYYNMTELSNFFNWTMTYRSNADVPFIYGRITAKSIDLKAEEIARFRGKARRRGAGPSRNKTAAWMVSHCNTHSQRETYVKELSKHIDVDIYGGCGNLSCALDVLHHSDPQCYDMLESNYKFYLSFENSLCPDYVTEKFFKIMAHDILPVVYGAADYTKHAPPHSFIDAGKWKPRELAAYLKLLDANDALYDEYFWWKDHYRVEFSVNDMSRHGFCDLCQKLHEPAISKSYKELASEWGDGNQCKPFHPSTIS